VMTFLRIVIPLHLLFEHDLSENRCPPIGSQSEGMLFRIMLYRVRKSNHARAPVLAAEF